MSLRLSHVAVLVIAFAAMGCRSSGKAGSEAPTSAEVVPGAKAPGLEDFVAGTGAVRLRMTEEEVTRALGVAPEKRQEQERVVDASYRLGGDVPGVALARFVGGPLVTITFSLEPVNDPPLPRITGRVSSFIANTLALKSIRHTFSSTNPPLEMAEVLAQTGTPGRRVAVKYSQDVEGGVVKTSTSTTWLWEVEPGGWALIVEDADGVVEQPIVRQLSGN